MMRSVKIKFPARAVAAVVAAGCVAALTASWHEPAGARENGGVNTDPPVVRTDSGAVIGIAQAGVARFLGIPYAAPTGRAERFQPPQPRRPWSTPLDATRPVAPCAQDAYGVRSVNEDCLILNVFAPQGPAARRPVMVYLHGGGYTAGTSNDFDPTAIVTQADVVVVTVNYRLGPFGFIALPGLDAESLHRTSGNYGLLDQQAALRWVQRNIARFGGDPRNVTLFGGSAGAGSLASQLVSPAAAGLFQRGIAQSLPGTADRTLSQAQDQWHVAIEQANRPAPDGVDLGCPASVAPEALVECLRNAPAEKLANVGANVAALGPIVDGHVIPMSQHEAFRTGRFNRVPLVFGSNRDEGTFFVSESIPTQAAYLSALESLFGPGTAGEVSERYPANEHGESYTQAYAAGFGDWILTCPTQEARAALSHHVPTYGYEFSQPDARLFFPIDAPPDVVLGATHTAELTYVFGMDAAGELPPGPHRDLSRQVISYWTSFARTGHPNASRGSGHDEATIRHGQQARPYWPRYREGDGRLLSLSTPVTTTSNGAFLATHHCEFWNSLGDSGAAENRNQ